MLRRMSVQTLTIAVPGEHHQLEARRRGAGPLAIVAPPHPLYGGTIGNPVVHALETAYQAQGRSTLAFNFRGTGLSTGEPSGAQADACVDYLAAARSQQGPLASLSGYSFGSIAALAAALELDAPHVLMVGPPLGLLATLARDPLAHFGGALTVVVGDDDEYAPVDDVRRLFESRPRTTLSVLANVDHYFLGSAVARLTEALAALPLGAA